MAARAAAPKQRELKVDEDLNSFNAWKDNLLYILSLNNDFAPFLAEGATWRDDSVANRGLVDDTAAAVPDARLRLMLGQIANFATTISRNQIVKYSTSLSSIWSDIREHYDFQCTGSNFLTLSTIKLKPGERPQDLYQRLVSFFEDNLLTAEGLLHHGAHVARDETMTPTLQNVIVWLWLERIHVGLPGLVQQKYGAELRNRSLASIKSEVSLALQSLLNELETSEDSRIMRAQMSRGRFPAPAFDRRNQNKKNCCLCEAAGRSGANTHYLSQCKHLPPKDKERFAKIRLLQLDDDDELDGDEDVDTQDCPALIDNPPPAVTRRVRTRKSPYLTCMLREMPVRLCLDTGAESNLVSNRFAKQASMKTTPPQQGAVQADDKTPLDIIAEVKNISITYGSHVFKFDALVTRSDIGDVIAGEPFLEDNDVAVRPAKKQIIIKGRDIVPYQGL